VEKGRYAVVLFFTTNHAMRAERILARAGIANKLIPVPRQLSSDCGVCLRIERNDRGRAHEALTAAAVTSQGIFDI